MKPVRLAAPALILLTLAAAAPCRAQRNEQSPFLANFPFENTVPLNIVRDGIPSRPFSVVGPRSAILGLQDGSFEAWIFPWEDFQQPAHHRGK